MIQAMLQEIGLSKNETLVYTALLKTGSTRAGRIVEETNLHRKNVYDCLTKLVDKGLATFVIENKVRYFQAKHPRTILRYLEERKNTIDSQMMRVEQELQTLTALYETNDPQIESQIYRGIQGIKTILEECLNYNTVEMIGATGDVENRLPYYWPHYNKAREEKKCTWKLLLVDEARNKNITKSKYYDYKILPKILSGYNVIYIYGDYVANILWLEKPIAFVIQHAELARNYRKYFAFLWESI